MNSSHSPKEATARRRGSNEAIEPLNVGVFTAARSDFGPLSPVIKALQSIHGTSPIVIATAAHLIENRGTTNLELDISPDQLELVAVSLPDSDPETIVRSIGPIAVGVGDVIARRSIDVLVVLGDRWELLATASAALIHGVPIVHLHGGEVTSGAIDDRIRHAVTKLSDLHCCASEDSARRLRQLGEPDERIVITGAPGLDRHSTGDLQVNADLEKALGIRLKHPIGLVTYHPETVDRKDVGERARTVLELAAEALGTMIVTYPGVDPGADAVISAIEAVSTNHSHVAVRPHIGSSFTALLSRADALIGNSSSGIWEAASFELPVVDVGQRQAGRLRPRNVIHCEYGEDEIRSAIAKALDPQFRANLVGLVNPYGDGNAAARIVRAIVDLMYVPHGQKLFVDRA